MILDSAAVMFSWWLAFQLRFDFHLPSGELENFLGTFLIVLGIRLVSFCYFGLYRGLYRYASLADLTAIMKAVAYSQVAIISMILFIRHAHFSRGVLIMDPLITLFLVGFIRFGIRATRDFRYNHEVQYLPRALIYGAGDLGESVLRDVQRARKPAFNVVGFLDDDQNKWDHQIHGLSILGGKNMLPAVIENQKIDQIIVAVNHSRGPMIKNLMALCSGKEYRRVEFKTIPTLEEHLNRKNDNYSVRKIELSDLLPRKKIQLDMAAQAGIISGKTVMVTGAGGTIGAELCRQVLRYGPKRLVMLENHNTAMFYIEKELVAAGHAALITPIMGDVKDAGLLDNIFKTYGPQVIFHAAAHKHVPLMETNPQEAVKNNTLGTYAMAQAAAKYKTERFLYISTDKAVRPSSVMGASKRLGEMVLRAFAGTNATKYMSVRFGNVLGSSGSVVKIFQEQIQAGGPLTVTDPEATRYFMTVEEAIQLILQACSMGKGGEIFVLNMGTPVKVDDLARNLIVLNGLEPDKDIEIQYTGMRAGEKMYEELFRPTDVRKDTGNEDIFMAIPEESDIAIVKEQMNSLRQLSELPEPGPILDAIRKLIPAYTGDPLGEKAARQPGGAAAVAVKQLES